MTEYNIILLGSFAGIMLLLCIISWYVHFSAGSTKKYKVTGKSRIYADGPSDQYTDLTCTVTILTRSKQLACYHAREQFKHILNADIDWDYIKATKIGL